MDGEPADYFEWAPSEETVAHMAKGNWLEKMTKDIKEEFANGRREMNVGRYLFDGLFPDNIAALKWAKQNGFCLSGQEVVGRDVIVKPTQTQAPVLTPPPADRSIHEPPQSASCASPDAPG